MFFSIIADGETKIMIFNLWRRGVTHHNIEYLEFYLSAISDLHPVWL